MTPLDTKTNHRRRIFFSALGIAAGFLSIRPAMSLSLNRQPSGTVADSTRKSDLTYNYKMSGDGTLYRRASGETAWERLANFGEGIRMLKVNRSATGSTDIFFEKDFNVFSLHSDDDRRWRTRKGFRRLGMKGKSLARTWA